MDIDDIEKNLGNFSVSKEKVMEALIYLTIDNNAMLKVLLENQSKINQILDPSKTQEEYRCELSDKVKEMEDQVHLAIMNIITNK
jgi:hypothetical protein